MFKQTAALLAATLALGAAAPAQAHGWGVSVGIGGPGWGGYARPGWGDGRFATVCSGERGWRLQQRLAHEVNEGEIDPREADRIAERISRLQYKARHECAERDGREIWDVAADYDRLQERIERAAHGGWRRRW